MTRRLSRFPVLSLLLFAGLPLVAKPQCTVTAVYSRKPLVTLCGLQFGERSDDDFHGELDVYRGKKAVFEMRLDAPPNEITIGRTPDGKRRIQVVVAEGRHNDPVLLFRWTGRKLSSLGELSAYWGIADVDIDGDGKPELLETDCCGSRGECATHINIGFQRWNGKTYQRVKGDYLDLLGAEAGKPPHPVMLSATKEERETGRYRLIAVNGGVGLRAAEVRLNGRLLLGAKQLHAGFKRVVVPLDLRGFTDCPQMTAVARGLLGARLTVLIETLPQPAPAQGSEEASADDELEDRLTPLLGDDIACSAVYDSYPSGRPHHVLAGIERDGEMEEHGTLLLVSFPDSKDGQGKLLQRLDVDDPPVSIDFLRLIDPRDIVVTQKMNHVGGSIYRIVHGKLVRISDSLADAESTPDLDGDGIPEIIWIGGHDPCGNNTTGGVLRWNGTEYLSDGRRYAVISSARAGTRWVPFDFRVPAEDGSAQPSHYILHVYRDRGVSSFEVKVDDEVITPETRFDLENDCHTLDVTIRGKQGAKAWAMIEQRHDVKPQKLP